MIAKGCPKSDQIVRYVHPSQKIDMMTRSLLVTAMVGALAVAVALPAAGAAGGSTATSFTLTSGPLNFSNHLSAGLMNNPAGSMSVGGVLGAMTVTDNRGGTIGWNASAIFTAFTGPGQATATSSPVVMYDARTIQITGTAVIASSGPTKISVPTPVAVVTASAVSGSNKVSWNPSLTVTLPASAPAGSDAGAITTSVF